jgi:hypothetical protein
MSDEIPLQLPSLEESNLLLDLHEENLPPLGSQVVRVYPDDNYYIYPQEGQVARFTAILPTTPNSRGHSVNGEISVVFPGGFIRSFLVDMRHYRQIS